MDPNQVVSQAKTKIDTTLSRFNDELKKLRTGRAHTSMLDGVVVEAYGQQMPLIQVATVSAPDATLLQISPFDPNNLEAIVSAISNNQNLGLNPTDDGRIIRVPVPPLTTERRQEIAKQIGEKTEETMIAMRQVRHDALRDIDQAKKSKDIGEDDAKRLEKQIDEAMNTAKNRIDAAAKAKEQEIMTI